MTAWGQAGWTVAVVLDTFPPLIWTAVVPYLEVISSGDRHLATTRVIVRDSIEARSQSPLFAGRHGCLLVPWTVSACCRSDSAQDLILPVGIIASVLVILVPMPPALLDVLLSVNIAVAVIILLTTIYVRTPLEFSVFPSLLAGDDAGAAGAERRHDAAGSHQGADAMARWPPVTWSKSSASSSPATIWSSGIIIFLIIVVIQFVVITKGATRISEVAARFALDGMPGRQMAIDADLNAGIIDENEAQRRRQEITRQADFFGAMDGASKFVRGDAIAGIVITIVNIVGGLIIGVVEAGMPLARGAAGLHQAHDRRRPGQPGAGVLDFAGRRLAGHAQQLRSEPAQGIRGAVARAAAGSGGDRGVSWHVDLHQPADVSAADDRRVAALAMAADDEPQQDARRA